jgi:hypothetical protein
MEAADSDSPRADRLFALSPRRVFISLVLVVSLWMIVPMHTSVWWHIRRGSQVLWQNTAFRLPYAWSVSELPVYAPGGIILERRPWFPFTPTPYVNTVYLDPPLPAGRRERVFANWRSSLSNMHWGPVSEFSKTISTRTFHCVSLPAPLRTFPYSRIENVHSYCQEQTTGWQIAYLGAPQFLDESLEFLGKGGTLPSSQIASPQIPSSSGIPGS